MPLSVRGRPEIQLAADALGVPVVEVHASSLDESSTDLPAQLRQSLVKAGAGLHLPATAVIVGEQVSAVVLGHRRSMGFRSVLGPLVSASGLPGEANDIALNYSPRVVWRHSLARLPGFFFRRVPDSRWISFDAAGDVSLLHMESKEIIPAPGTLDLVPTTDGDLSVTPRPGGGGLEFYVANDVIRLGRLRRALPRAVYVDQAMDDQYPSVGILSRVPDFETRYRIVTSWHEGVAMRDYVAEWGDRESVAIRPTSLKRNVCGTYHLSTPILSPNGRMMGARDEATGTTKLFAISDDGGVTSTRSFALRAATARPSLLPTAALLLAALGCSPAESYSTWEIRAEPPPAHESCEVPPSSTGDAVRPDSEPMCDLVVVPVTTLVGGRGRVQLDPGREVVRRRDGRFITTTVGSLLPTEWSPDGRALGQIGTIGDGPGELAARGQMALFVGPSDSLFVLDGSQRWTVFDPENRVARSFDGSFTGRNMRSVRFVDGIGILTGAELPLGPDTLDPAFLLADFDGNVARTFGDLRGFRHPKGDRRRHVIDVSDDGFWSTPPSGAPQGLILQFWSFAEGAPTDSIVRHSEWLPDDGYEAPGSLDPALPEYDFLEVDQNGYLWVSVVTRDPRWLPINDPEEHRSAGGRLFDGRVEVLDPVGGALVFSYRYDAPTDELPPFSRFVDDYGYRVTEDAFGVSTVEVFDLHFVTRSSAR